MRYRLKVDQVGSSVSYKTTWTLSGTTQTWGVGSIASSKLKEWMYDVVQPRYKERIAQGEIISNPMWSVQTRSEDQLCKYWCTGTFNGAPLVYRIENPVPVLGPALPIFAPETDMNVALSSYQSERDLAVSKAWSNVSLAEMQTLASLGEMPETIRWICSLYERAISLMRNLIRRKATRVLSDLKDLGRTVANRRMLSDLWLEFRYAVRPLVFEMVQAVAALKATVAKGTRQTARGYNEGEEGQIITDSSSYRSNRAIVRRKSDYRAGVLYTIDEDINGIMSIWGFDEPISAMWELTPFSFILDWFFSIGTVIASWSPKAGLRALTSFITETHSFSRETLHTGTVKIVNGDGYIWNDWTVDNFGRRYEVVLVKRRYIDPSRPILPQCYVHLDVAKILDLALIGQALLRSFRHG